MRARPGSPSASPGAMRIPDPSSLEESSPAGQRRVRRPHEVRLTVGDLESAFAQAGDQHRTLAADVLHAILEQLAAGAQRLERPGLGDLGNSEVRVELGEQRLRPRSADGVADAAGPPGPMPSRTCGNTSSRGLFASRSSEAPRRLCVRELDERLVEQHRDTVGNAREQAALSLRPGSARPSDRSGWRSRSPAQPGPGRRRGSSSTPPLTRTACPWARRAISGYRGYEGHSVSSCWPGSIRARVAELSSSAAPLPRISRPGSTP